MSPAVQRVRLDSSLRRGAHPTAAPLLRAQSEVVLGGSATALAQPVVPGPATLFGPRGLALCGAAGPLWVADTGHHRLLGWARPPAHDDTPADWLIGQPDFGREGRNAKGPVSALTLNVPTGVAPCGAGLAVADAWNHRVLIWHALPRASHAMPDLVLGQDDLEASAANRGAATPTAASLFWPYGVHFDGTRLWVADSGNRRVLMWQALPTRHGQPADLVLGQRDFMHRDENGGAGADAASLRWPHAVLRWQGRLVVADAGNNRVMLWPHLPKSHRQPSDHVLGQVDAHGVDCNAAAYWPSAASLNMPYGAVAAGDWLVIADTANSRLLAWHADDCTRTGVAARALAAQPDFGAKGDNRWSAPARDSLCWPYGLSACGDQLAIADSGNNRVVLARLAPGMVS